ncbi:MAG: histidine phosphatase family protein [Ferrovum sp. 37-45-19]|uniref:SixA phosphatase family protein n=1 Tax=Ferrovum sp. JA12 TaxID=1356299 RepID=UPI000702B94D|nr:histidine phosphatase family protein [Ferrovum sp. JA12]OYV79683.1 MAG: histidine phosphatase family protein [Ferrovum sp. 21-44-67]OYV94335.1 MAG: histidine phosphatase family protein [Ferrovum sp. 37-45-19]OZB32363.1 MAG: histidine phosphatase family protein [Ferrovum sp. 34-44-207]HQT80590.1 histidine phosphatase family protein [Ferrovaceae bacterium]KRH79679.1 phosphohistidine phosphatase SixA [Ferrovum sp. JA12]
MDLILWRHADAVDSSPDHLRPLSAKGVDQATRVANWLKLSLPQQHYRLIVSPALRTQSTARALSEHFETNRLLAVGGSAEDIIKASQWPHSPLPVIIVGHQPTLGQVASLLIAGQKDSWSIKKGAIWWLTYRERRDSPQVVLRAVLNPDMV